MNDNNRIDTKFIRDVSVEDLLKEELTAIASLTSAVKEILEESNFPELDPEKYFIWMYSVEPFAEA